MSELVSQWARQWVCPWVSQSVSQSVSNGLIDLAEIKFLSLSDCWLCRTKRSTCLRARSQTRATCHLATRWPTCPSCPVWWSPTAREKPSTGCNLRMTTTTARVGWSFSVFSFSSCFFLPFCTVRITCTRLRMCWQTHIINSQMGSRTAKLMPFKHGHIGRMFTQIWFYSRYSWPYWVCLPVSFSAEVGRQKRGICRCRKLLVYCRYGRCYYFWYYYWCYC